MKLTAKYNLLLLSVIAVTSGACWNHTGYSTSSKDSTGNAAAAVSPAADTTKRQIQPTSITENFEQGSKEVYVGGNVTFKSGDWYMADALTGATQQDAKNGGRAVRIRNQGSLAMQFDVQGVTQVSISYASFGKDGASSWQLLASADGGHQYRQIDSTVTVNSHSLQQAVFKMSEQGGIRLKIIKTSGGKNRINIDDITLSMGGNELAGSPASSLPPASGDNSNLLLGNPSNATGSTANAGNYLINHRYYVESYNRDKAEPNWVCWHISAADLGNTDRLNNFRPDEGLPAGWFRADPEFYKGSGFDKGHNCPSGDRTSSTAANSATFLTDNMIPQAPNNNQHTWEHFESYCRDQVRDKGAEVYVIMGSYGSGGTGRNGYASTIDHGRINVPAHIWKVAVILPDGNNDLARINSSARIIAIDTPNDNNLSPNWMNYTCTVRDIEQATGYHLLSALPQAVQNTVETRRFTGGN